MWERPAERNVIMVTSNVNGNQVKYENNKWQYVDFDNAPESWFDRCSGDGHERYSDEEVKERRRSKA